MSRARNGTLPLLPPEKVDANAKLMDGFRERFGDNTPLVAVAALGALTRVVPPEDLAEALMAAQISILILNDKGDIVELLKAEVEKHQCQKPS